MFPHGVSSSGFNILEEAMNWLDFQGDAFYAGILVGFAMTFIIHAIAQKQPR